MASGNTLIASRCEEEQKRALYNLFGLSGWCRCTCLGNRGRTPTQIKSVYLFRILPRHSVLVSGYSLIPVHCRPSEFASSSYLAFEVETTLDHCSLCRLTGTVFGIFLSLLFSTCDTLVMV